MIDIIDTPANTGPRMTEVWAFVSRDAEGKENVIAQLLQGFGATAFITGNPQTFEKYRRFMGELREELEASARASGKTIHLLRFTRREEIPW